MTQEQYSAYVALSGALPSIELRNRLHSKDESLVDAANAAYNAAFDVAREASREHAGGNYDRYTELCSEHARLKSLQKAIEKSRFDILREFALDLMAAARTLEPITFLVYRAGGAAEPRSMSAIADLPNLQDAVAYAQLHGGFLVQESRGGRVVWDGIRRHPR